MIPNRQQYSKIASTILVNQNNNTLNLNQTTTKPSSSIKDFEKEFPSLQQSYKKNLKTNNNNLKKQNQQQQNDSFNYLNLNNGNGNSSQSSSLSASSSTSFSDKDIELLKVFRNEIFQNEHDCWKKRDLLYYVFIQKQHEIFRIAAFINSVANYYELPSRNHLLDIGCGLGRMFEAWDRSKWQHIDAFEPDKDYFQFSLNHAHNLSEKVKVYNLGFVELSQIKEKYDMVVSIHGPLQYLTKLEDRIQAVRNIYGSLNDGGVILLDVSNFLDALRNLRPQVEQKMLVNGVPVKRISNITVDTFNSIWSVEDIFYSNSGIKNQNQNNNNTNDYNNNNNYNYNQNNNNDDINDEFDSNSSNSFNEFSSNNIPNSNEDELLNEFEYADGSFVVEQLQFSILSVNELKLLLLSIGFINIKVVSSWGDSVFDNKNYFAENHGPRIIITGQKPKKEILV